MAARGTGGQSGARDGLPIRRRYSRVPSSVRGGETDGRKERRTINDVARSVQCGEADCREKYRAVDSTICRTATGPEGG